MHTLKKALNGNHSKDRDLKDIELNGGVCVCAGVYNVCLARFFFEITKKCR